MSASPGTEIEYSRGSAAFRRLKRQRRKGFTGGATPGPGRPPAGTLVVVFAAALGALIVIVAQFTTLYEVHTAAASIPVKTVGTGANHAWAPIPLALFAALFAFALYRHGNRAAPVAIAVLGIATLLIALLGDRPDAHASGLIGSGGSQFVQGISRPSAGLYIETLGGVLLLISGGVGFLMLTGPDRDAPATVEQAPDATRGRPTTPPA